MRMTARNRSETRNRILHTAMDAIREKGYAATGIDEICRRAGITKGAFFHHFKDKQQMAVEAAEYFAEMADQLFKNADYNRINDPLKQLLGYIDFREQIITGQTHEYTCLLGTLAQEVHSSHPAIRQACERHMWEHAQTLVPIIQRALDARAIHGHDPQSLALFTQAVLQGGFILAKASGNPEAARESVRHLRAYIQSIFHPGEQS